MTEAAYWLAICGTRCLAGFPSMVADPWCKRLLSEAAYYKPEPVGRDGFMWRFEDGSQLIGNSDMATAIGPR